MTRFDFGHLVLHILAMESERKGGALRLRGGGGDGGTKPPTHAEASRMAADGVGLGKGAYTRQWADAPTRADAVAERASQCAASSKPLAPPLAVTALGYLCNKEDLLSLMLARSLPPHLESHVASLREVHDATLEPNPGFDASAAAAADAPFQCPVTKLPLNGRVPFVFLRCSGCVVSERALKLVGCTLCPVTEVPCAADDVIPLYGTAEQKQLLSTRLEARRAATREKKRASKAARTAAAGANIGASSSGASAKAVAAAATSTQAGVSGTKRAREWDAAVEAKAKASEVFSSLFLTKEQRRKDEEAETKNFAARVSVRR